MKYKAPASDGAAVATEGFHTRLKRFRLAQELSLGQVGTVVGVTKTAVFRWEAGDAMPRREYLSTIAELMKVSIPVLMLGEARAAAALQSSEVPLPMTIIAECKDRIARSMGVAADCVDVIIRA